jgi:hypothetical protein
MSANARGLVLLAGLSGLDEARARLQATRGHAAKFIPLSEALYWIGVLDELLRDDPGYESERQQHPAGAVIPGLRYARNFHTHQAVATTTMHGGGMTLPFTLPLAIEPGHVVWRKTSELPAPSKRSKNTQVQKQSYDAHLSRRDPAHTTEQASLWFHFWDEHLRTPKR